MKGVYCNECKRFLTYEMLNDLEAGELKKEGSFVCSDCINNEMEQRKEMIKVSRKVLEEYKATIERTIILIEDNHTLEDKEGFYNSELILFELGSILKDIKEVLK